MIHDVGLSDGDTSPEPRRRAARVARQRRRMVVLTLLGLATAAAMVAVDLPADSRSVPVVAAQAGLAGLVTVADPVLPAPAEAAGTSAAPDLESPAESAPAARTENTTYASTSTGAFGYVPGDGPVLGSAGSVRRFQVAVEEGIGQDESEFASEVQTVLGDPRGWTLDEVRFQRVPEGAPADFTILLASPVTSESMCAAGGLQTEGYSSCRLPGQVIINVARWTEAVPGYGAPVAVYRAYAINHEVGHQLGYGHEACAAPGRPAPVMQQQTYGLRGCVANPWPFLNGRRYTGPPVT